MISSINRAIDLIVQGSPQGAEVVLERALDEAKEIMERLIKTRSELDAANATIARLNSMLETQKI